MSVINFKRKEIVAKVVYYGPGLSGKTTNVQKIHDGMPSEHRGELTSLPTEQDRTLFFDYIPIHLGNIGGFKTRFQIFTVPGQVYYSATRRVVLQGTDGVVFVADSSPDALEKNLESLADLRQNLLHYDKFLNAIPFVIQYNKRDVPGALSVKELEKALNSLGVPHYEAVAMNGVGVIETLSKISSLVLTHLKSSIEGKLTQGRKDANMVETFHDEAPNDESLVKNLLSQITEVRKGEHATELSIVDEDEQAHVLLPARGDGAGRGEPVPAAASTTQPPVSAGRGLSSAPVEYEFAIEHGRVPAHQAKEEAGHHPAVPPASTAMAASRGEPRFELEPAPVGGRGWGERVIERVDVDSVFRPSSGPDLLPAMPPPTSVNVEEPTERAPDQPRATVVAATASSAAVKGTPGTMVASGAKPAPERGGLNAFAPGDAPPWDPKSPSTGSHARATASNAREGGKDAARDTAGHKESVKETPKEPVRDTGKETTRDPVRETPREQVRESSVRESSVRTSAPTQPVLAGNLLAPPNPSATLPGKSVHAPVGVLEVTEVGQVSRRGAALIIPLTVKDTAGGPSKSFVLQLNLSERELPESKVVVPIHVYGWLLAVSALAVAAVVLAVLNGAG